MPLLLAAECGRRVRFTCLSVVQDEVHGLHGYRHGKLRNSFLSLRLSHLAHVVSGLDISNDTQDDPLGSHLVDGAGNHTLERHRFLVDDDFRVLCFLRFSVCVPGARLFLLLLPRVSCDHVPRNHLYDGYHAHEDVARVQ